MGLIIQNGDNKYEYRKVCLNQMIEDANNRMIEAFKKMGIDLVNFISLGNSIATGYSISDTIMPLFMRNESLEELLKNNGIDVNFYNFCRAQKNRDANVFEWLEKDYTASKINAQIRYSLVHNNDNFDQAPYPVNPENDRTFKDINTNIDERTSNIVVYNGGTGTFLDDLSRGAPLKALGGFKEDRGDMKSVLRKIYCQNPNTQVYVCGIPYELGLKKPVDLSLNRKIREICEQFPNVVYVNPAPIHCLYRNKEGEFKPDFHPNEPEYLSLMHNIISSIADNYIKTALVTMMYQEVSNFSDDAQYVNADLRWKTDYVINAVIPPIIEKYSHLFEDKKQLAQVYEKFIKLFKSQYPHDFYYIGKKEVLNELDNSKKTL